VAFELAQQLRQQGQEVALLVLLDPDSPPDGQFSSSVSSSPSNLLTKITLFRDKVNRHSRTLALLGSQEKLVYILERVKERVHRIETKIKDIACRFYLGIGRRMPPALRMFYFLEAGDQATRKYVPHVYPGRVILFHTQTRSPDLRFGWGRLVTGELEVYEVPGGHLDIMGESHVRTLAAELRACLSQTQAAE
jgi:thioesterase domain-containing protein